MASLAAWLGACDLHRIGQITYVKGGPRNEFFGRITSLAKYFGATYEATRRNFHLLVSNGWLTIVPDKQGYFNYVHHDDWAQGTDRKCMVAPILTPWQGTADPFVGQLWAAAGGRFRGKAHWILGVRKYATDDLILDLFRTQLAAAKEKRKRGEYRDTGPGQCSYQVAQFLKEQHAARVAGRPTYCFKVGSLKLPESKFTVENAVSK